MRHLGHVLVGKSKHTTTIFDILQVARRVVVWQILDELAQNFWSALAEHAVRGSLAILNRGKHRHSFEGGVEGELLDLRDLDALRTRRLAQTLCVLGKFDALEALFLNGVANKGVICEGQGVSSTDDEGRVFVLAEDLIHVVQFLPLLDRRANTSNALDDEVILGERACFVEATNVDFSCHGDPPRLGAKDLLLNQLDDGVVDCDRELHGQLGWHDIRDNQDASQQNFVSAPIRVFQTLSQHVVAGCERKHKQNEQVGVHLWLLNADAVLTEENHAHKLALLRLKTVFQDVAYNAFNSIWQCRQLAHVVSDILARGELQYFCAAMQNMRLVLSVDVQRILNIVDIRYAVFDERLALTSEDCFVDDGRT